MGYWRRDGWSKFPLFAVSVIIAAPVPADAPLSRFRPVHAARSMRFTLFL
jgi:hypothetical protein